MTASVRIHRKALVAALAAISAPLLFAACGSSTDDASDSASADSPASADAATSAPEEVEAASDLPKTLVFSPLSLSIPALKGLSEGLQGYGGSQGWEIIVQDPDFDPSKQVQQLNEVIGSGRAGAAWVIAVAPPSMADVITVAQDGGIPILVNGRPDEYGFEGAQPGVSFGYIDYEAGGAAIGEQLGLCINDKLGGQAQVLFAQSAEGQAGKAEFEAAAEAALAETAPGAEIVTTVIATDRAGAQTEVGSALQGNPDVAAVLASNDEGALGAIGAFEAAGKEATCVSEFGGNDEVLGLVETGTIWASVALDFEADLKQSFDTLVTMQADPSAEGLVLVVPQKVVTATS